MRGAKGHLWCRKVSMVQNRLFRNRCLSVCLSVRMSLCLNVCLCLGVCLGLNTGLCVRVSRQHLLG